MSFRVTATLVALAVLPLPLGAEGRFVAPLPGPDEVVVKRDIVYRKAKETSRAAIVRTLDFLSATLGGGFAQAIVSGQTLASASAAVYREDWPAAVAAYEGLVLAQPQNSLLWQRLGEARRAHGDPPGAVTAFEKALVLGSPNHGMVSFALATLHAQTGNVEKAVLALQGMKPQLRFFADDLRTEPVFEGLRKDPRLAELLKDVPPPPR